MGKRKQPILASVDVASFPPDKITEGKNLYVLRCMDCHSLGRVLEIPAVKQQGPDLIRVASRVHFDWAKTWILDPKKVDPTTKMTVPGLSAEQADAVRMFVWKTSIEAELNKQASRD
jgi:cytochrome c2